MAAGDGGIDLAGGGGGEVEGAEVDDGVGRGGAEDDAGAIGDAGEAGEVAAEEGEGVGLEFAIDGVAGEEGVAVFVGLGEALEAGAGGGVAEAENGRGVGFVGLGLGECAAADHHVQEAALALARGLGVAVGAQGIGALGQAAEEGGFAEGEGGGGGVEVGLGGGFDADVLAAVGGVVEVGGEDFVLGVELFHLAGAGGLEELAPEAAAASGGEAGHLHREGGGARDDAQARHILPEGAQGRAVVDAPMAVEVGVLGDEGGAEDFRGDGREGDGEAPGVVFATEGGQDLAIAVVDPPGRGARFEGRERILDKARGEGPGERKEERPAADQGEQPGAQAAEAAKAARHFTVSLPVGASAPVRSGAYIASMTHEPQEKVPRVVARTG